MRRLILSAGLALILLFSLCSVALASDPLDVQVEVSDIVVVGDPWVGNTITASGTVTIIATSDAPLKTLQVSYAEAESDASFTVTDPNGITVDSGANSESDDDDGWKLTKKLSDPASADASQTLTWSSDIYLNQAGDWVITQGGEASAEWATYFLIWRTGHAEESDAATCSLTITAYIQTFGYGANLNLTTPQGFNQSFHETFGDTWTWRGEDGYQYVLYMPDGTEITGYNGNELGNVFITVCNGVVTILPPWAQFSQPVTIYQVVNGELVELMTFSQVENGVPIPLP